MKDEEEIPWRQVLIFLFLLVLGMSLPFWMEYKSRANPLPGRFPDKIHKPTIEDRNARYCPACGGKISLPAWSNEPSSQEVPMPTLSLKTLTEPSSSSRVGDGQP